MNSRTRAAFTLVELIIVIALILLAMGMITLLPRDARRDTDVQAAANELAATLRLARNLAMDKKATFAVSFNIQNAPGTSGKVLNNWSGGHWYQIIGPDDMDPAGSSWPSYPIVAYDADPAPFSSLVASVKHSFAGDRHILPRRRVRFLALGDQDTGRPAPGGPYPATYPRPWAGHYDASAHRLYPWGGYDATIPNSGFFYQGSDPAIVGCVNPATRIAIDPGAAKIFTKDSPRPLVNGEWEDYLIQFRPDGSVAEALPFLERKRMCNPSISQVPGLNIADVSGIVPPRTGTGQPGQPLINGNYWPSVITSFNAFTGGWYITLAPDVDQDSDRFDNVDAAYHTLMPAYRVMVNAYGLVKVVKVATTYQGAGAGQLDTTMSGGWWQTGAVDSLYQGDWATNPDMSPRDYPVDDFLTPDMLQNHSFWLTAP
jgi:type II secretory pathway pseudopilin PulG